MNSSLSLGRFSVRLFVLGLFLSLALVGCKKKAHKHKGHKHVHAKKGHKHTGPGKNHKNPEYKHDTMRHSFDDVKLFVKIFDNPKRKLWQKPALVTKSMDLKPGMSAADIGAGTGYFLPYLRASVGDKGKVWGLDVSKPMVKHMAKRIKKAGWKNVTAKHVKYADPLLGAKSVDRVLIVNTWHHVKNRVAYAKKLKAALKAGGAVFVVDFKKSSKKGPMKKHKLKPEQIVDEFKKAGMKATILKVDLPDQYIVKGS